jgi:N-acetylglucosamine kinase-like BadF-type ATPase
MSEDLILVVDGGRSHLRAAAISTQGTRLGEVVEAGLSPGLNQQEVLAQRLLSLPSRLASQFGFPTTALRIAVAGLAGFGREADCRKLESLLCGQGPLRWLVESDAAQTLRAAEPKGPVVVALLGTGSAFFARDAEGAIHRTGGWGQLLEDSGSGFELARQTLLAAFRAHDGMGGGTALMQAVCAHAECQHPPELLSLLYREPFDPSYWAGFAPLVLKAAEEGDAAALEIVRAQVGGIVRCLEALAKKARLPEKAAIHLTGGLVRGSAFYSDLIHSAIERQLPGLPCRLLEKEAYWGGWQLGVEALPRIGERQG